MAETVDAVVNEFANGHHGQSELRLIGEFLVDVLEDDEDADDDPKGVCLKAIGWLEDALRDARAAIEAASAEGDDHGDAGLAPTD